MTDSVVEAAAKAAFETMADRMAAASGLPTMTWETETEELREDWRVAIRAAIAAMRVPTPAMVAAMVDCYTAGSDAWEAGIDAALKE